MDKTGALTNDEAFFEEFMQAAMETANLFGDCHSLKMIRNDFVKAM